MRRYTYTVSFSVIGSDYRHAERYSSACQAIAGARMAFWALAAQLPAAPELLTPNPSAVAIFDDIRRKECTLVSSTPRSKAFEVSIAKRSI